jgi:hypothetical protein
MLKNDILDGVEQSCEAYRKSLVMTEVIPAPL